MAVQTASTVRLAALRSQCLSWAKNFCKRGSAPGDRRGVDGESPLR